MESSNGLALLSWAASIVCKDETESRGDSEKENWSTAEESASTKNADDDSCTSNDDDSSPESDTTNSQYWLQPGWIPVNAKGLQKSPHQIRNELTKYVKSADITKTALLQKMGVNSNSYRKFIANEYKDPWSATQNGTYWAAAMLIESEQQEGQEGNQFDIQTEVENVLPKKSAKAKKSSLTIAKYTKTKAKRAAISMCRKGAFKRIPPIQSADYSINFARAEKKNLRDTAIHTMRCIYGTNVDVPIKTGAHRTLIRKIQTYLETAGVSKVNFCREALGGVNSKTLDKLLDGTFVHNLAYDRAYVFFVKKRVFEKKGSR